jgi:DNA-binding NtrC family response regulator
MKGRRILVVDDEEGIRKVLTSAFTRAGYVVRVAADAKQAMALCESEPFDIVLSDVVMPGKSGHELAQWMVMRHPTTPTVLMTGFDDQISDPYDIAAHLSKPFVPKEAVALVDGLLQSGEGPILTAAVINS